MKNMDDFRYALYVLTRYTAVLIKNCLKNTSVIKVATMKITDNFHYAKEAIMHSHQINPFHYQQR